MKAGSVLMSCFTESSELADRDGRDKASASQSNKSYTTPARSSGVRARDCLFSSGSETRQNYLADSVP